MSIKKRHPIRSSDIRDMKEELKPRFGNQIEDLLDGTVETAELEDGKDIIIIDGRPAFIKKDGDFMPLIFFADRLSMKKVTVDMGAVKHITDGADVMAPGVVNVDKSIAKGEIVNIEDEKNNKTIALGNALKDGPSLIGEKGKVIENKHHVGDELWDLKDEF